MRLVRISPVDERLFLRRVLAPEVLKRGSGKRVPGKGALLVK